MARVFLYLFIILIASFLVSATSNSQSHNWTELIFNGTIGFSDNIDDMVNYTNLALLNITNNFQYNLSAPNFIGKTYCGNITGALSDLCTLTDTNNNMSMDYTNIAMINKTNIFQLNQTFQDYIMGLLDCSNITGSVSNLCTIIDTNNNISMDYTNLAMINKTNNFQYNISAPYFMGKLNCSDIQWNGTGDNNFCLDTDTDTQKSASLPYLYNDSSIIFFNETMLNITISQRDTNGTFMDYTNLALTNNSENWENYNITADWFLGKIDCSNITSATSNLCTLTDTGMDYTNLALINKTNTFTGNISAPYFMGKINCSDIQSNGTGDNNFCYDTDTDTDTGMDYTNLALVNKSNNFTLTNAFTENVTFSDYILGNLHCSNLTGSTSNLCTLTDTINSTTCQDISCNFTDDFIGCARISGNGSDPNLCLDDVGGMDYTNLALVNKSNNFTEDQYFVSDVGIGTSPTYPLDISWSENDGHLPIRVINTNNGTGAYNGINFLLRNGASGLQIGTGGNTTDYLNDSAFIYAPDQIRALYIETAGTDPIIFRVNNGDRMKLMPNTVIFGTDLSIAFNVAREISVEGAPENRTGASVMIKAGDGGNATNVDTHGGHLYLDGGKKGKDSVTGQSGNVYIGTRINTTNWIYLKDSEHYIDQNGDLNLPNNSFIKFGDGFGSKIQSDSTSNIKVNSSGKIIFEPATYILSSGNISAPYFMGKINCSDVQWNGTGDNNLCLDDVGGMDYTNIALVNKSNNFTLTNAFTENVTFSDYILGNLHCSNLTGATSNLCTLTDTINSTTCQDISCNFTDDFIGCERISGNGSDPNLCLDDVGGMDYTNLSRVNKTNTFTEPQWITTDTNTSQGGIRLANRNNGTGAYNYLNFIGNTGASHLQFGIGINSADYWNNSVVLYCPARTSGLYIETAGADPIVFRVNGGEAGRFDIGGNFSLQHQLISNNNCGIPSAIIWAEEGLALSTATSGGKQFSFGNGETGGNGLTQPCSGVITAMSMNCRADNATAIGVVQIMKNGVAQGTGCQCSTTNTANDGATDACELNFIVGDEIGFITTTSDAHALGCTPTMWVRYD